MDEEALVEALPSATRSADAEDELVEVAPAAASVICVATADALDVADADAAAMAMRWAAALADEVADVMAEGVATPYSPTP